MKKALVILLSVMMVLAFTSCEKDKSEDSIAAFEAFSKACMAGKDILSMGNSPVEITTSYFRGSSLSALENLDCHLNGLELSLYSYESATSASGSVKNIEGYTDNNHLKYENIVVKYPYTYNGESGTREFEISGSYSKTTAEDGSVSYVYDFEVNGEGYKAEYTVKDGSFTAASVNGTGVNLRLVNAAGSFKRNFIY